jgi:hypothetical protein
MSYYEEPDRWDWDDEDEDDYYEDLESEENEIEAISEAEMLEALAEEAGDNAFEAQEDVRLVGPFAPPIPARIAVTAEGPQQGGLFEREVA